MSETMEPNALPPAKTVLRQTALALLALGAVGAGLFYAADRFADFEIRQHERRQSRPRVISSRPVDGEARVPGDAAFRAELNLPNVGVGVDPATLTAHAVRLVDADGGVVPARLTAAADGGSVSLTPVAPLAPGAAYRFEVTSDLRDAAGLAFVPFDASVTVARQPVNAKADLADVAYERIPLPQQLERSMFTVLAFGPGGDLFAGTADGRIFRYGLHADGTLWQRDVVFAVPAANNGPRVVTGLAFDPRDGRTLWVSHGVAALEGADDFTGRVSTLGGDDYSDYTDRVVGLPRGFKDHLNFALRFDPRDDATLYLSQGSNTGSGAPDSKWNFRPERPLSAAILRIDRDALPADAPLDVATPTEPDSPFAGGSYDPLAPGAAVTVHATGVRSGYDLLFHSSGRLLTAINGAGRGGNTPAVTDAAGSLVAGPVMGVPSTTDDVLADVTRPGSYHGHPNPSRGERVLMGGNPTAGTDSFEVPAYRVGVAPERRWARPIASLGKGFSVNGLHESTADVFGGAIRGMVFAARMSAGDDLVLIDLGDGVAVHANVPGLGGLASPLDVVEDPLTGNLYVSEFDTKRLVLLRPSTPAFATTDAAPAGE